MASRNSNDNLVVQLTKQCVEDSKRWFPGVAISMQHYCLGLAGEAGEFIDIVKKIDRGTVDFRDAAVKRKLAMELTDVFIYVLNLAALLGIDLSKTYEQKRTENERRFGSNGKR